MVGFLRHLRTRAPEEISMVRTKRWGDVDRQCGPGLVMEYAREDRAHELWQGVSCMSWIGDGCSWQVHP